MCGSFLWSSGGPNQTKWTENRKQQWSTSSPRSSRIRRRSSPSTTAGSACRRPPSSAPACATPTPASAIVKNRLTLRAADEAGTDGIKDFLSGPTALALVKGDAALAAKTLNRLGSEWELLSYKGGLMDGEALDPDSFTAIARLPGRDALNAQLAGIVASPITGLVRGLGSMIQGLALQLGQIAEQGLVTGEAPAEAPAEEEKPSQEEAPKEDGAPAAAADTEGSGDEAGDGEDAPSDGEAEAPETPEETAAEQPDPDPEPTESPEESSEEQAPEGEDAGQDEPAETGEGDADIGEDRRRKKDFRRL